MERDRRVGVLGKQPLDNRPDPLAFRADAAIALRFRSPLELLVSVMLSAQTTDVNVNRVTERLFEKYRKPEDYLAVPQEELDVRAEAQGDRGVLVLRRKPLDDRSDAFLPGPEAASARLPDVASASSSDAASFPACEEQARLGRREPRYL